MVWIPLSYFLFYGFYQSLTYKKVLGEGIHAILFSLMNHYALSGNLVGISINLCKSIQKELFINDTP